MKQYDISVICSDTTTFSHVISAKTKAEATAFAEGVEALYKKQGKSIYLTKVKLRNPC